MYPLILTFPLTSTSPLVTCTFPLMSIPLVNVANPSKVEPSEKWPLNIPVGPTGPVEPVEP